LRILSPTIFIASLMAVVRGYFQGMNTMLPTAISQVVEQLFNALFSVILATYFVQYGVAIAAAGSTMGTGIGALCGFLILILLFKKTDPTNQIPITSTKPLFKSRREIFTSFFQLLSQWLLPHLSSQYFR
ncbi:MAG: oligosaccharide flippase family protein, partial [Niameybacter sp.]|nr:oligosaccharide flippase family protein [Niameybacter sp.]